jgi:hypothetical protein
MDYLFIGGPEHGKVISLKTPENRSAFTFDRDGKRYDYSAAMFYTPVDPAKVGNERRWQVWEFFYWGEFLSDAEILRLLKDSNVQPRRIYTAEDFKYRSPCYEVFFRKVIALPILAVQLPKP